MKRRRVVCPRCGRSVALMKAGQIYPHGDPPKVLCPASGFTIEGLRSSYP